MRYVNNGIEIQYRECQILRETAKSLAIEDIDAQSLADQRDGWICAIREIAENSKAKKQYAIPIISFLSAIEKEYLNAVAEYTVSLIEKERGIDIMVPYITSNKVLVLPVNTHASIFKE